jgi:Zn-dependent protease
LDSEWIAYALFFYVAFLFSTVCHEAAHALVGKWGGDETAYWNGQVTLSPVPHIQQEPFGLGLLPIISLLLNIAGQSIGVIGFASAPFDPDWARRHPRRAAWMAMAGPAANFILFTIATVLLKVGLSLRVFEFAHEMAFWHIARANNEVFDAAAVFLGILAFENLLLGVWNMLPIPPMDGFSTFLFFIPDRWVDRFFEIRQEIGMFFPMMMLAIGSGFSYIFQPIALTIYRAVYL